VVQSDSDASKRGPFEVDVLSCAMALAAENCIDVEILARANGRRFESSTEPRDRLWNLFVDRMKAFIHLALRHDYPVRLLRNSLPTKLVTSSHELDFKAFVKQVLEVVTSEDPRTAYWFSKNMSVYRAVVDVPFAPDGEIGAVRHSLHTLSSWRQHESASKPGATQTRHSKEKTSMGATFDLFGPESLKRYLFQYWVYDTNTDEIAAEGSFIAKGDTLQEATRHLMETIRNQLGPSASPSHKLHVKMVDQFTKVPASSTKTLAEQFVDAVRDQIKKESPNS
jgi:hypothetical protein